MDGPRTDAPRTNRDPAEVQRKMALLRAPHVAALTDYVERLRAARGGDDSIPWIDPTDAGVNAPIVRLLEAPGQRAAFGSGFVSSDNDDPTAENMWRRLRDVGLDRGREIVGWSAVPWYVGSGNARQADIDEARPAVHEFVSLLREPRVVVLLGRKAAKAWRYLGIDLPTIECPHPSPLSVNRRPGVRDRIREALVEARNLAGTARESVARVHPASTEEPAPLVVDNQNEPR